MNATSRLPEIFRYIVHHDMGFAPNPFYGICTLACCKPDIRKAAVEGDYVIGFGSKNGGNRGRLVYWMVVDEIVQFDDYWSDPRFQNKRPQFGKSLTLTFGDNIYHRCPQTGDWLQEESFHSDPNSLIGLGNIKRDTHRTDNVLIAREYVYWGGNGPIVPERFKPLMRDGARYARAIEDRDLADQFIEWLKSFEERGYHSEPAMWTMDKKIRCFFKPEVAKC